MAVVSCPANMKMMEFEIISSSDNGFIISLSSCCSDDCELFSKICKMSFLCADDSLVCILAFLVLIISAIVF